MKTLLLVLLYSISSLAQVDCPDDKPGLVDGLKKHVHDQRIELYAKNDKAEYKIVKVDSHPSKLTDSTVEYDFTPGKQLKPGECIYMSVPEHLRNKPIWFVNLAHKADEANNTGWDEATKWDNNPALTTVQVNESNEKGQSRWRYWGGQASGKQGAKFAEVRPDMELEGLYEWYHNGHHDVKTGASSESPLLIDGARVCSIGKDPVMLGGLSIKLFPGKAASYQEFDFGKNSKIGDSLTAEGRNYGEREGSIVINGPASGTPLPAGWQRNYKSVTIPAPVGKKLKTFEVSVTDMHEDGSTLGWARLNVSIRKANGTVIPIIQNENVPPEGVLIGSPESQVVFEPGDKIVMDSQRDATLIKSLKIGLD